MPRPTPSADLAALSLPWEQQAGETDRAYAAFVVYRDTEPGKRSLDATRKKLGKVAGYQRVLEEWSSKYEWGARAVAHDQDVDRRKRDRHVETIVEMNARQATIAQSFEQGLTEPLYALLTAVKEGRVDEALEGVEPLLLMQLVERSARLWPQVMRSERLARGESTENPTIQMPSEGANQPPTTLDRMAMVHKKYAEMGLTSPLADAPLPDEG